jgi:NADPH:quinone reductase-like Zn-dependent oxidoreductase
MGSQPQSSLLGLVEPLSTYLENWKAPTSAVTRCDDTIYVPGFPPFDPATGTMIEAPIKRQTGRLPCRRGLDTGRRTMKAIVVTEQAAGTAGMKLVERPEPQPAINDVVVQIHASGFVPTEMEWPSTWTDRHDRDRTPSIPGHELAGVVTALGWGTTGLSVGQRVFGLADWYRDGTLAEYVAIEARNLAPLPGDVDFTVGASLPISGLTAWQGLFQLGHLQAGQSVLAHGAAGAVGTMVTQLAREFGAYVIGTGRAADRQKVLDFGAQEFVDLDNDTLEDVGRIDLVFDVIGGGIQKRSASLIRAGGTLVSVVGPAEARLADGLAVDFVVESDRAQLSEIVQRVRDGRLRPNIGNVSTLDDAVAALNPTQRRRGKTIIRVRP